MAVASPVLECLSDNALGDALSTFVRSHEVAKLKWWLACGQPAEHWVQFEYAFALSKRVCAPYEVFFEYNEHSDIAIVDEKTRDNRGAPAVARLELKVPGAWWTRSKTVANGIKDDIEKVRKCSAPSLALSIWVLAKTHPANVKHAYINDQTARGVGIPPNQSSVEEWLRGCGIEGMRFIRKASAVQEPDADFEHLDFLLYAFRNDAASA
jgi:hypothetical protein